MLFPWRGLQPNLRKREAKEKAEEKARADEASARPLMQSRQLPSPEPVYSVSTVARPTTIRTTASSCRSNNAERG